MLPDTDPPPNLDHFREFAQERGQSVRREYHWGGEFTDEDGNEAYSEPGWETLLVKEEVVGEKVFVHVMGVTDTDLIRAWEQQWGILIELNEAGFNRTVEEHAG